MPPAVKSDIAFQRFNDESSEITAGLIKARELLQVNPDTTIRFVVPDLARRYDQVQELARQVFYPQKSPLSVMQNDGVYRFSLGTPLLDWPQIDVALTVLKLLKNRVTMNDISYLLFSPFLVLNREFSLLVGLFDGWLRQRRVATFPFERLHEWFLEFQSEQPRLVNGQSAITEEAWSSVSALIQQISEYRAKLLAKLDEKSKKGSHRTLSFEQWVEEFNEWLQCWQWRVSGQSAGLSSVQHQLLQRWQRLMEEFAQHSLLQSGIGLHRALDLLQHLARETIFLPKSAAAPMVISGVLEALGRESDVCFLLQMDHDYPESIKRDAFLPTSLLVEAGYPSVQHDTHYGQSQRVIEGLLHSANQAVVSYSVSKNGKPGVQYRPSPLFRKRTFVSGQEPKALARSVDYQFYRDQAGPAVPPGNRQRGGSTLFSNQSQCAFKAFATHRLQVRTFEESEFGLDALDRGNILHRLLDRVWGELGNQSALKARSESQLNELIAMAIEIELAESAELGDEKRQLLTYETDRLQRVLLEWLHVDAERPAGFQVIERETQHQGSVGGIVFQYQLDRLDQTDDGRRIIIDYKTGSAERKDWTGERIRSPQLPLYAVAMAEQHNRPIHGIAFAKVKQTESKYVALSEAGIFKASSSNDERNALDWQEQQPLWPHMFEELAQAYLSGDAQVNPIDTKACEYCGLQSLCRVSQLASEVGLVSEFNGDD